MVTTPQENAIELNQIADPTLLRTRLLGSSKIKYYPSSISVNQFSSQNLVGKEMQIAHRNEKHQQNDRIPASDIELQVLRHASDSYTSHVCTVN